jgi:hypothetical protein
MVYFSFFNNIDNFIIYRLTYIYYYNIRYSKEEKLKILTY